MEGVVTIEKAARHIGISRDRLKRLCIDAGVVIHHGGSARHPHLRVLLTDAERVYLNNKYVPQQQTRRPRPYGALHPLVRC